ncbi:ATP-dependent helicase [Pseudalkalibacillus berkeleyi]|uniref:DNA 3'-5' helicase n=1 Tax=Pseudalkalibacillus berkeleyi TaxID=1069813 RepID=A0ABS9GY43_9BACL|nr:UvrD-helicase domain-containing protein [Pseudalkalibacillus berkeleyi]MCF6136462.1 ATP-dependent helicase [Pseudalkalibacillus berkeleyi]
MLNRQQIEAVEYIEGPLLILAGPGSGKTRTISSRYEHLLRLGVKPKEILMVTFTRKAANEMKSRIAHNFQNFRMEETWVETFHRICMEILKKDGNHLGVPRDFKICNQYESKTIVQNIINRFDLRDGNDEEEDRVTKEVALDAMNKLKTNLISPHALKNEVPTLRCMNWDQSKKIIDDLKENDTSLFNALKVIYPEYQKELLRNRLMDFDDMMFYTVGLLDKCPEVLERYQEQFKYIMVDEMQDTNHVQFKILELLAGDKQNICVVGDDAQSIYGFRGAAIENILDFDRHFSGTNVVKLEQNYRSTKRIVDFSNSIIRHNKNQKVKSLFTENELGEKITVMKADNDEQEAEVVAKRILAMHQEERFDFNELAVLFRNNSHMNKFAKVFDEHSIPFRITGDIEFVDRIEIRDILAYLKLIENPEDATQLRRIINKPKRGIGRKSIEYIFDHIGENAIGFLKEKETLSKMTKAGQKGIKDLVAVIESCGPILHERGLSYTIEHLLRALDYENKVYSKSLDWMKDEVSESLNELIRLAKMAESEKPGLSVEAFREYLANLYVEDENQKSKVTLMTIHKSKGLEFPVVFVSGMDNLTFPNEQKEDFESELEEERRVLYVAATRAEKRLFLSYPLSREKRVEGTMKKLKSEKSLFLKEIGDSEYIEEL